MAGLGSAIHALSALAGRRKSFKKDVQLLDRLAAGEPKSDSLSTWCGVDGRVKPGYDAKDSRLFALSRAMRAN